MSKPRLEDIAREANCSIATVSYVLNNNPHQKISSETRIKILQVASLLGYNKNTFAQALASGRTNHIGVYVGKHDYALIKAEMLDFVKEIADKLMDTGFYTTLLTGSYNSFVSNVDAILCIDLDDEDFNVVAKYNTVPTIAIDTKKHVPWTFEIASTYEDTATKCFLSNENYIFVCSTPNSQHIKNLILKNNPNTIFISNFTQLVSLQEQLKNERIVVADDALCTYINALGLKPLKYPLDKQSKLNKIVECIKLALSKEPTESHDFYY